MPVNREMSLSIRQAMGDDLLQLLSHTYVLFLKTHGFHWNLGTPTCSAQGLMLEEQYVELAFAVDAIAERICALGFPAPGSYSFYARLSSMTAPLGLFKDDEMIEQLIRGHDALLRTARELLLRLRNVDDQTTVELVTQRVSVHEDIVGKLSALQKSL